MALKGKKTAGRPLPPSPADNQGEGGWWSRNWHTFLVLMAVVLLAFLLRVVFVYGLSTDGGYFMSGGPDAAYHQRIIEYIVGTGSHLVIDPLLNYPMGMINPNPPLMDWSVALGGMFLSLFGMPVNDAALWVLVMHTAVLGALSCIPVYLIAREAFGRRAGMVAALLFAVSAGAIGGSVMSNGDHDAFVMFFILWTLYFLLMALRRLKDERYVESYSSLEKVKAGFGQMLHRNRLPLAYAVMSGLCLAAVELTWKGFTYVTVIIIAYFFVQLMLDRFTGKDSLAVTMVVSVALFTGIIIGAPYYIGMGLWQSWYDIPTIMAFGALFVGMGFSATRDKPWTLVLPAFVIIAALVFLLMSLLLPDLLASMLSGQGYFGYNKLYSTIAEAQAPSFSKLATEFGWLTIWLSFLGVAYMVYRLPKNRSPARIMITVWLGVAIYMASSANRFIFNGAPAFAIAASMLIVVILDRVDLVGYMREVRAAGARGMWRKMLKPVPLLTVLAAVFMIMAPNVLFAVDASMPYNVKAQYDQEIYDGMPSFLRPSDYSAYQYLGTSGFSVNTPQSYNWYDAWEWLSQQDSALAATDRPAFLSWWDYGHEAVAYGQHPSVADNFQNGYQLAGSFFTSQSEADSIALLIARLMENTDGYLVGGVRDLLVAHGLDADSVEDMLFNGQAYVSTILANPDVYGPYTDDLSAGNARYIVLSHYLASSLPQSELVDLYSGLRQTTGKDIGYVAIDYRMFPLYYGDSNILAALTLLSDFAVDEYGVPSDFYQLYAVLSSGGTVPLDQVTDSDSVSDLYMVYQEMLYSSMLWRLYAGYTPADLGLSEQGIGGLSGSLADYQHMPAWNMSNYRAVYTTAFYNPYDDYVNHSDAWQYISYDEGLSLYDQIQAGEMTGVVDLSPTSMMRNGVFMAQYYDGVIVNGTVSTESGAPAADVRVTVFDEYGIPHMTVLTDANGSYEVMAPFGNVTVAYTYGDLNPLYLVGEDTLAVQEYSFSYEQAMRVSDYQVSKDLSVSASSIGGSVYLDLDNQEPLAGAEVNISNGSFSSTLYTDAEGNFSLDGLMPGDYNVTVDYDGHTVYDNNHSLSLNDSASITVAVSPASVNGTLTDAYGNPMSDQEIRLLDLGNGNGSVSISDNDGAFSFLNLLPGDYELQMVDSNFTVGKQALHLGNGESMTLPLQMLDAAAVNGTVTFGSQPLAGASLLFRSADYNVSVSTSADGSYEVILPAGFYSLYVRASYNGSELVNLSYQSLGGDGTLDVSLETVRTVSGHVTQGGAAVAGADIYVRSASGAILRTLSSATGYYRLDLPAGDYQVLVQGLTGAIWSDISASNATLDFALATAYSISGMLWYDADGDGMAGEDEGMAGETVRISSGPKVYDVVTTSDGMYDVMLPAGSSYSLSVSVDGFTDLEVSLTGLNSAIYRDLQIVPEERSVSGSVELYGSAASGITVQFIAVNGSGGSNASAVSDAGGQYTLSLLPGDYQVRVWQNLTDNDSVVYSGAAELSVGLNQAPQDLDLDIERMIHTSVTTDSVDDVLTIGDWTDTGSLSYQLYLSEGNHSVYAVNDAEDKVYLALHTVNASSHSIAIVTGNAHVLSGALTYDGGPKSVAATITAVSATGAEHSVTASASMYSMRLPAGTYAITAQYSGLDDGSYYRYTAFDNITISASEVLNLQYGRAYANSTVNITVSNYDAEENQTTLQFHANDATAMDATLTLVDNGSVSLAPGEYTVYAFNSGDRAYLGTFSVALDQDSDLHVGLQEAYALSGVTRASSLPVSATMTVQQGDSIIELQSDIDGRFSLILPAGYYEIASSAIVSENGVSVQYVGSFAKSLHQTADDVYDMLRHDQRRIALVASGPVDVDPGQSYVFNLNVANTGNTLETVTLSSNGWTMVFTQNELIMDYGSAASSQSLQFTLQVPSNAVVGQQVKVLASAADGTPLGSYTLDLNVSAHAGVDLAFAQAQGTDGSSYRYAVYVNNTGNAAGSYTLDLNAAALAASGWQASLVDSGGTAVSQVTVVAYSSQTVYVKLTPQGEIQTPPLVTIAVSGDEQDSLTFTAPLPEMSVGGEVSVSGPDVYSDGGEVPLSTWFMLGASILAIMLFLMMGITRGVFSRRKR